MHQGSWYTGAMTLMEMLEAYPEDKRVAMVILTMGAAEADDRLSCLAEVVGPPAAVWLGAAILLIKGMALEEITFEQAIEKIQEVVGEERLMKEDVPNA